MIKFSIQIVYSGVNNMVVILLIFYHRNALDIKNNIS